ncbi:MAG: diguanylate cyclase [Anaerolineaceae bacterium]|nr:diguanylate cyclase [Anaerolineaceae bacterium]
MIPNTYIQTLAELPCFDYCVDSHIILREIVKVFDTNPDLPGIIVRQSGKFYGMVSRDRCFELLGRPFGVELFLKLKASEFLQKIANVPLVLNGSCKIQDAVRMALERSHETMYDPLVVVMEDGNYRLVEMQTLLAAQGKLLTHLYNEVQQLSIRDPLSNLYNRRGFFDTARLQIDAATGKKVELCALMVDIDNFKMVNDIYGHYVGDCVIRAIADECNKQTRQTDLVGRYGGEEFIILLLDTPCEAANQIAERIRSSIESLVIYIEGYQVSVTVSIGISQLDMAKGSLDTLINQADQAMYAAKWTGRNTTLTWDPQNAHKIQMDFLEASGNGMQVKRRPLAVGAEAARIYDETIIGWARALELRDKETEGHAQRVTSLTLTLAGKLGITGKELVNLRRGALLHDIGKIAIPDSILFKPGPLNPEERELMQKHPVYAFELLSPITYLQEALAIPYNHHEWWDGSGYPRGLKGLEIPLQARIFTLVDVWDALSTDRCYRSAWPPEQVKQYIQENGGKLFDPDMTPVFLNMLNELTPLSPDNNSLDSDLESRYVEANLKYAE